MSEWAFGWLKKATVFKFQLRPQISWNRGGLTSSCSVRFSNSQKLKDEKWWLCFLEVICSVTVDNWPIDKTTQRRASLLHPELTSHSLSSEWGSYRGSLTHLTFLTNGKGIGDYPIFEGNRRGRGEASLFPWSDLCLIITAQLLISKENAPSFQSQIR